MKKALIKITLFSSSFVIKTPKRKKSYEVKVLHRLLVILHLLIIVGLLPIVVIIRNMSKANAKATQLDKSQQGVGVRDGQEDRYIGKLQERLVPLTVDNLLLVPYNLYVLLHDVHALIREPTHHKNASEHLQEATVGVGGRRGTTAVGSARSHRS
jgi:hypothetical protein